MAERDKLKREKCFPEYKKLRNKVNTFCEKSKNAILPKAPLSVITTIISSVWRALDAFTTGHRSTSVDVPKI